MPSKSLPSSPSLDHLKYQAKDLLNASKTGNPEAFSRIREFHPKFAGQSRADVQVARVSLSDAQLVIAREYGFESWPALKQHVESLAQRAARTETLATNVPGAPNHAERVAPHADGPRHRSKRRWF
jgi:hypothetical protein